MDGPGGLYLSSKDGSNDPARIRYVDPATSVITTAVGFIAPSAWTAGTGFSYATRIAVTVSGTQYLFVATQAGISGTIAPNWPTALNATIQDGAVTWKNTGVYFGGSGCSAQTDSWGDGCTALQATVGTVTGMAVDQSGNLYCSDTGSTVSVDTTSTHSMVRRVDAVTKIVTAVAGNGTQGYAGDGGPATQAELIAGDIAFDNLGNLYIVDAVYDVPMVNASNGKISTITGEQINTTLADLCTGGSGDGGPASSAGFGSLTGIAIDLANNVYLVDEVACNVRRIDSGTQMIVNVGGQVGRYQILDPGLGDYGTGDSDGSATEAILGQPELVRLDGMGNMYIASGNGSVRKIDVTQSVLPFDGPSGYFNTLQIDTVSPPLTATVLNAGSSGVLSFASLFTSAPWGISSADFTRDVTNPTGSTDCYDLGSVSVGFECPINIDFTPTATGQLIGVGLVSDNAANTPQTIALFGIGAAPVPNVTLLPFLLSYPTPQGGRSGTQTLTLSNNTASPLAITGVSIAGIGAAAFAQTNNCGAALAPNSSCGIAVTFSPTVIAGSSANPPPDILTAQVTVMDSDAGSLQTANLTGTETIHATDLPSSAKAKVLSVSETIHATDAPTTAKAKQISVSEAIHTTDTPLTAKAKLINLTEAIHTADTPSAAKAKQISVSEAIHATDTPAAAKAR